MAKKDSTQPDQRFACDRPGCDKSYSRPDHLLRHKLNHDVDRVLCCNQCDRTFVRQDLLVRHLERHALRGKTLGRWSNKAKDKAEGSGSSSSRPKASRRASKAAKVSHEPSDSENEFLDPALGPHPPHAAAAAAGQGGADFDDSFGRYPGPSSYGDLPPDAGPSPSSWAAAGGYEAAGHPLDLSSGAMSSHHAPPHPQHHHHHPPHQHSQHDPAASQWSPPGASASSATALSPPFRRSTTMPFASVYGDASTRNGGPSPADLLPYDGSSSSGGGRALAAGGSAGPPGGSGSTGGSGRGPSSAPTYDELDGGSGSRHPPPPPAPWHSGAYPASATTTAVGRTMAEGASASDPTSFRWLGPDDLGGDGSGEGGAGGVGHSAGAEGGGSYAPPPSGAYYAGWPEASGAGAGADVGGSAGPGTGPGDEGQAVASANQSSAVGMGAPAAGAAGTSGAPRQAASMAMPPLANHDIFPFAPPTIDHTADYGWLFDGMDPFGSSSAFPGLGRFDASRGQSQASAGFSPSSSDGLGGFLGSFWRRLAERRQQRRRRGQWGGHGGHGGGGETASFGRGMSSDGFLMSGSEAEPPNALEDLAYFASLQAEIPSRVTFHVDPVAHHRLLVFLSSVSELPNSPLFTPSALRCYIYLFFAKFNRLYPLLHEPTFAASTTDPMLLSAVVVIGAHFAALPAHELAVRIAQKIWGAIVSLEDFRPARATLPMLQAMVLTECFGKMMSSRPQHEMSHLFHNFIITLARRNAVFNPSASATSAQPTGSSYEETDEFWRGWAREEEKKRIALFAFMLDAQHATTFRHIPALSAFQIQLNLPCSDDEWSKASPDAWKQHRRRTNYKAPTPFIPALKACLSPGKTPHELDAFPRFVLLHGLMSIAYDLHWKQNILLGAENSAGGVGGSGIGIGNWKDRLSAAYSSLQARMDIAYIKAEDDSNARLIHRATPSLVSAAQVTLFADTIDIQIYAGLPSVLGRFIDRATFNASRRSVKEWAKTSDGATAVWHAVNFLRTSLLGSGTEAFGTIQPWRPSQGFAESDVRDRNGNGAGGDDDDAYSIGGRRDSSPGLGGGAGGGVGGKRSPDRETGLDEVLHHRWCQYLCALVIWAYGHALATPRGSQPATASSTRRPSTSIPRVNNVPDAPFPLQGPYVRRNAAAAAGQTNAPPLKPEAVDFLERMSTKSPEGIAAVDCKCYTKSVLELVEKELRGSRWELGREASGVLRKLISNHALPEWDRSDVGGTGNSSSSSHRHHPHAGQSSNSNGGSGGGGGGGSGGSGGGPGGSGGGNSDGFKRPPAANGGGGPGDDSARGNSSIATNAKSSQVEAEPASSAASRHRGTDPGLGHRSAPANKPSRDGVAAIDDGGHADRQVPGGDGNAGTRNDSLKRELEIDADGSGSGGGGVGSRPPPARRMRSSPGPAKDRAMSSSSTEAASTHHQHHHHQHSHHKDGNSGRLHGERREDETRAAQQQQPRDGSNAPAPYATASSGPSANPRGGGGGGGGDRAIGSSAGGMGSSKAAALTA
ncbi:uncharacterized protein PFL1_02638 [Pseudozyma flocculosa PF-1]|uniref:C2H2-type domain-containing protein n=1 Tax=Pseudozyma flocculosa PF-1 TaxID=1277687 RepID=A0A061HH60_9BASI|nr:uncharacterized protein PFL1_02638 [Pseudozyma flocculosa PF-1]EPQ29966.1 hypothetical protein PFL1_02638 [Pseudozyma flocculosa PF-1]